ncbi:molecular chaperone SurA [Gammaproteobacteria bacterium 42_54_T18]|nr:molecular chaperone SurA [Gammaproteobacteria bacterium 42_54_T18]
MKIIKQLSRVSTSLALVGALTGAFITPSVVASITSLDRIVAVVDEDVIMESELTTRIATISSQLKKKQTPLPPADTLKSQVLDRMILENLQLQLAERAGIRLDDDSINKTIRNIARQNNMTAEQFRNALADEGLSYKNLRTQISREMTLTQLRQRRVGNRIRISEQDVNNFLSSDLGKTNLAPDYHLGHILIPVGQSSNQQALTLAEEKSDLVYRKLKSGSDFAQMAVAYSSGQKALEGGDLGWRKAAQLPTLFAETVLDMKKGDISEPIKSASGYHIITILDLRGGSEHLVTQTNARHILIKPNEIRSLDDSKKQLQEIKESIVSGKETFEAMAKTYSDDTGSALEGGDLGWFNPGTMVKEFEQTMATIEPNVVSETFQTQYGWHILEVLGRRNQDMSEEFRQNRARQMLHRRKFDEELNTWLRELRQNAYVETRL